MKSKEYLAFEEVSPYNSIDLERLNNTKESFKNGANEIDNYINSTSKNSNELVLMDAGCANGEFIYFLSKKYPSMRKVGVDLTESFIKVANELNIKNSNFISDDLFEYSNKNKNKFDIVTSFSVIQIFKEPDAILKCLFSMLKPGGLLIAHGCFNPYNVSVNIRFKDDSIPQTKGVWRSDFNQHSYLSIEENATLYSDSWEIKEFDFNADIPKKEGAPAINNWTETLSNGKRIIVNGANIINHKAYLIAIKK